MAIPTITVYTDYKSPYAFIAKAPTYQLEERFAVQLEWLPYTLNIESYLGSVDSRDEHQWRKVRYGYMDARRLANRQGLTLKGPQRIFNAYYASVGMLFAKQHDFFRAYNDAVFERFWRRELDLDSLEAISEVIVGFGGDSHAFREYAEGAGRVEHDEIRNYAESIGVFGVPSFVLDGELFFGGDRLDLLMERLRERGVAEKVSAD